MAKSKRITSIGGQALIEGIMMRGPHTTAAAFVSHDGTVTAETFVQLFQYVLPLILADLLHGQEIGLFSVDEIHHRTAAHAPRIGVGSIVIADIECPCKDGILIPFDRYIRFPSATGDRDSVDYSLRLA